MKTFLPLGFTLLLISCNHKPESKETVAANKPEKSIIEMNQEVSRKVYSNKDIDISLEQTKSDGRDFYCKAKLLTSKNNEAIDSLNFSPEPVGGSYGISKPRIIENHVVFTKHGDYDGRTIIVNEEGQLFNLIGGEYYYDEKNRFLFSNYESDLSGFSVFDLNGDSLMFEIRDIEQTPISFHKAFGERYFFNAIDDDLQHTFWEIEFDLGRIMQVDLDTNHINAENILTTWEVENVNCECEEREKPAEKKLPQTTYFDFSNSTFDSDFSISSAHLFSNPKSEDHFKIFVPKGNVKETISYLVIQNKTGDTLLYQTFPTYKLIYTYMLVEINSDSSVVQHIKDRVASNLNETAFINIKTTTKRIITDSRLEDFEDYDTFLDCSENELPLYFLTLGNEDITVYSYSNSKMIAVPIMYCC